MVIISGYYDSPAKRSLSNKVVRGAGVLKKLQELSAGKIKYLPPAYMAVYNIKKTQYCSWGI